MTASDSATLTVALSAEAAGKLAAIAVREHGMPDARAAIAVADLFDREAATVAAIAGVRRDPAGGILNDEVMRTRAGPRSASHTRSRGCSMSPTLGGRFPHGRGIACTEPRDTDRW